MAFGVYIHIPYCLQICPYCDFTKYEHDKIMPPSDYVKLLTEEIRSRAVDVPEREISTIYFGGGTPSLFEPRLILTVLEELAKAGFRWSTGGEGDNRKRLEMTLEIDPATCDQARLEGYLALGANRFSVGAQTFNERLLKVAGRKHSSHDTVELLQLLKRNKVNYSFDLLFGLPTQTLEELRADVATALAFDPSHLSAYCLTVPEAHPMSKGRAPDEEQVDMFNVIESELAKAGVLRYEISNFAKPGFESKHNLLYWTDQPYWGLGTSAHSYFPPRFSKSVDAAGDSGLRFWNAPSLPAYEKEVRRSRSQEWSFVRDIPEAHREILERHQALTDFCHTSLRLKRGLEENALRLRFGASVASMVTSILGDLAKGTWIQPTQNGWAMTAEGRVMANAVFEKLTFLADDLKGLPGPN